MLKNLSDIVGFAICTHATLEYRFTNRIELPHFAIEMDSYDFEKNVQEL